jgi:acyl-CoA thioesterase
VFINPDLTIYVEREPVGEWICLQAETRVRVGGIGFAEAVLFDRHGRVGRSLQALLVAPR